MLLTGTSVCCCFIVSFKNQCHVVIIINIILSNKVVTAAIRVGYFKKNNHHNKKKTTPFYFHRSSLWHVNCFSPSRFWDFDPGSMSVYLNNPKTSSMFFFSAVKIISLQRLKEASTTTNQTAAVFDLQF